MVRFLTWLLTTAVALAVAAWMVDGIRFTGPSSGIEELQEKLVPLLLVALILGAVSALVKPVLKFLSFPFIILTLGLFLLVINAAMLGLVALILPGFHIVGFWAALFGAVIVSITGWIAASFIGPRGQIGYIRR